jgi:AcrR family transcriptional regulator
MDNRKAEGELTFIAEARRTQIINAAIATLDEIGFHHASLAQIAKRAGISPALIAYHFRDKQELMDQTLISLVEEAAEYVLRRVEQADTPTRKLHAFIDASLAYQGAHPQRATALIEIIFHARTPDGVPYYKLEDDDDGALESTLRNILADGQRAGEFREFHVEIMASIIQSAIFEYAANRSLSAKVDMETYAAELTRLVDRAVLKDGGH